MAGKVHILKMKCCCSDSLPGICSLRKSAVFVRSWLYWSAQSRTCCPADGADRYRYDRFFENNSAFPHKPTTRQYCRQAAGLPETNWIHTRGAPALKQSARKKGTGKPGMHPWHPEVRCRNEADTLRQSPLRAENGFVYPETVTDREWIFRGLEHVQLQQTISRYLSVCRIAPQPIVRQGRPVWSAPGRTVFF